MRRLLADRIEAQPIRQTGSPSHPLTANVPMPMPMGGEKCHSTANAGSARSGPHLPVEILPERVQISVQGLQAGGGHCGQRQADVRTGRCGCCCSRNGDILHCSAGGAQDAPRGLPGADGRSGSSVGVSRWPGGFFREQLPAAGVTMRAAAHLFSRLPARICLAEGAAPSILKRAAGVADALANGGRQSPRGEDQRESPSTVGAPSPRTLHLHHPRLG